MPSFHVQIDIEMSLTARNMDEAQERAASLLVEVKPPPGARWHPPDLETIEVVAVERED